MALNVNYMPQSTSRYSGQIWDRFDLAGVRSDPRRGVVFEDDFVNTPLFASATSQSGYITYQDTSVTIQGLATDDANGILKLTTPATDNAEGSLTLSANVGAPFVFTGDKTENFAFEARIKLGAITETGFFIGMAEEGLAAANTLVDNTGAVADKDYLGFRVLIADPDGLDAVYNVEGQSEVVVQESAQDMVADTWYKVGFLYLKQTDELTFWVDNTKVATLESVSDLSATTFPSGQGLAPLIAIKTGEAGAKSASMDWWAVGSELC